MLASEDRPAVAVKAMTATDYVAMASTPVSAALSVSEAREHLRVYLGRDAFRELRRQAWRACRAIDGTDAYLRRGSARRTTPAVTVVARRADEAARAPGCRPAGETG